MASITADTEGAKRAFRPGNQVTLVATPDGSASGYQWKQADKDIAGATSNQYEFEMTAETTGPFTVSAMVDGVPVTSQPVSLTVAKVDAPPATPPPTPPAAPPEAPPIWHRDFAIVWLIVVIVIAVFVIRGLELLGNQGGFSDKVWEALDNRLKVAVVMALPLVVLGTVSLLTGLWMAVVEWRGRFAEKSSETDKGLTVEPDKIIEAVGKLRGATLAMVVGGILLLGAAWIGQAAASPPPAAPAAAATPAAPAAPAAPTTP